MKYDIFYNFYVDTHFFSRNKCVRAQTVLKLDKNICKKLDPALSNYIPSHGR